MAGRTPDFEAHKGLDSLASRFVDIDAIPWHEARPGLRMKVLFKDDEAKQATILMEAEPGAVITEHVHTGVEQTLVLEGSLEDDKGVCAAGCFVWRPVGSRHAARAQRRQILGFLSELRTLGRHRTLVSVLRRLSRQFSRLSVDRVGGPGH